MTTTTAITMGTTMATHTTTGRVRAAGRCSRATACIALATAF